MFSFKSISSRLIFYVTLSVLTLFTFIVGIQMLVHYILSYGLLSMYTSWHVDSKASTVEKRLAEVQTTILAHDIKVTNNLHSTAKLSNAFQDILYNNSIYACGIALMPDSTTNERYLLYATRDKDGKVTVTKRPNEYEYEKKNYYRETKRMMEDYWSDPYLDDSAKIATFSHPLTDADGNFVGVLCADVLLDSIANYAAIDPGTSNSTIIAKSINDIFEGAKSFVLSRNGYFITTPDSTVNYNETYETYALRHKCPRLKVLGEIIAKKNNNGYTVQVGSNERVFTLDEQSYHLAYSYINKVGWTVAILYPTEEINNILKAFCLVIFIFCIIGLTLLVGIIYFIVKRSTRPLKKLVTATEAIARGNFDIELPKAKHRDEVQTLRDSFDEMRLSLKDYVAQLKETTALNERMEQELSIASQIQMSMLPKSFPKPPEVPEISISAFMKPAREVGGDLYDFFIRRGHLYFIVGDVSGKGVPAAMIMAVTSSMFRARQRRDPNPERTMKALNNALIERNSRDIFVTLIVGDLNLSTGDLYICNAGHNPPILIDGNKTEFLPLQKNIPIGVFQNYNYQPDHLVLAKETRLLLYTDGVTEATNGNDEFFGDQKLQAAAKKYRRKEVDAFVSSMVNDINAFTGETPQSDDITLMLLEYHGTQNILSRELQYSNDIQEVTRISQTIEEICEELSVDPMTCSSLQLAIEEAVVNVIKYAYENKRENIYNHLKIFSDGTSITFILSDSGTPFDPTKAKMPDTTLDAEHRDAGGLGILLLQKLMDTVTYRRQNNRNILTLIKHINKH